MIMAMIYKSSPLGRSMLSFGRYRNMWRTSEKSIVKASTKLTSCLLVLLSLPKPKKRRTRRSGLTEVGLLGGGTYGRA